MKYFVDYIPIIAFFIAFKLYGIYIATAVAIVASGLHVLLGRWINHQFDTQHIIIFALVLLLGGATLLLHRAIFIQWKPTVVYWLFAVALQLSVWFFKVNLLKKGLNGHIVLTEQQWNHLNTAWVLVFLGLGGLNVYVVYHYSMASWVNFKLFGTMGLLLLFILIQGIIIAKLPSQENT